MSGHSKWANIRRTKEKMDSQRSHIFTKIGKELAVAVKSGGPDPLNNPRLRDIIAKAKSNNMPNDNIKRSIDKAAGNLEGANYESIIYEGYGTGGSAVIVEVLTDNRNRAAGEVRHIFERSGGSLGSSGCVSYLFDRLGILIVEKKDDLLEDQLLEWSLDAGASDFITEDEIYQIVTNPEDFSSVKAYLEDKGVQFLSAETSLIPQSCIDLDDNKYEKFSNMIERLEENDDVQNVYHNVNERE